MTPTEFKEDLMKQYEQAVQQVYKLQGAIAACDQLTPETTEEETTEE